MIFLSGDDKKKIHTNFRKCYRKRRYVLKSAAEGVVFRMRYEGKSPRLTSYFCNICKGYHVGNL